MHKSFLCLRAFSWPRALGNMRETLKMYTAPRMQNIVQIPLKKRRFLDQLTFSKCFEKYLLVGLSALRALTVRLFDN